MSQGKTNCLQLDTWLVSQWLGTHNPATQVWGMCSLCRDTAVTPGVGESCSSPVQPAHPWADPHCLVPTGDRSDAGAL